MEGRACMKLSVCIDNDILQTSYFRDNRLHKVHHIQFTSTDVYKGNKTTLATFMFTMIKQNNYNLKNLTTKIKILLSNKTICKVNLDYKKIFIGVISAKERLYCLKEQS